MFCIYLYFHVELIRSLVSWNDLKDQSHLDKNMYFIIIIIYP